MSTRELPVPMPSVPSDRDSMALGRGDPVEAVARVAVARRDRLLRVHRRRLRWEDLEDCYSQATLELVARAQRDPFASPEHIVNALEQKFSSRIDDRRRAIGGRSPIEMAMARALPVDGPDGGAGELEDRGAEVVRQVADRLEVSRLREVAAELTDDQRLVLACQISLGMDCAEFCRRFGWSAEKFRKVAQRARGRLRALVAEYQVGGRCRRLEPELLAYAARAASAEQAERATAHLANCTACASHLRSLDRASRQVAAVLPAPALAAQVGGLAKLGGLVLGARRVFGSLGRGASPAGAGLAGGSAAGAGALKLGVAAACLAGAAGGYAICGQGLGGHLGARAHHHAHAAPRPPGRAVTASAASVSRWAGGPPATLLASAAAPRGPVTGAAAAAVARREFGGRSTAATVAQREFGAASAHQASAGGSSSGAAASSSTAPAPMPVSSAASTGSGAAGSPGSGRSRSSAGGGRAASQAQVEFGGFER
jgi:DNA-directed RNA polymerase specialized sigma24 family protein